MAKNNLQPFHKMTGGGNDFVLFDNRRGSLPADYAALARKLCDRKFSIGADGLLVLEKTEGADFRMVYFNSDGSRASMCGNGARCIARFAFLLKAAPEKMRFLTDAGMIGAEVKAETVKIRMSDPQDLRLDFGVRLGEERTISLSSINTGVPHAVLLAGDIEKIEVQSFGALIRNHREFAPAGTNANFAQVLDTGHISVRTFERGVEGETLACGTGVVAASLVCAAKKLVRSPVECLTRGGETLNVYFDMQEEGAGACFSDVFLEGPAAVCFTGEVEL